MCTFFFEEVVGVVFSSKTEVFQFSIAVSFNKYAIVGIVFLDFENNVTLIVSREVVMNGFLVSTALSGKGHLRSIYNEQEVQSVNKG
jgi:hypothetical protein